MNENINELYFSLIKIKYYIYIFIYIYIYIYIAKYIDKYIEINLFLN